MYNFEKFLNLIDSFISSILRALGFNFFPPLLLINENSGDDSEKKSYDNSNLEDDANSNNVDSNDGDSDVKNYEERNIVDLGDNHNGPERIMDDLDLVDKARKGDQEALDELKNNYKDFFEGTSNDKEALEEIEQYLEDEFEPELERSEAEADALEAYARGLKHPRSEGENENPEKSKRRRLNDDDENNSGGNVPGSSGGAGPSGDGSNFNSKIGIFLLGTLEFISDVIDNITQLPFF